MAIIERVVKIVRDIFRRPDDSANKFDHRRKMGTQKFLHSYKSYLMQSFEDAPREQQKKWVQRFCQVSSIGVACIILNSFYSVLLPPIRIISLPVLAGIAWHAANIWAANINSRL